MYSICIVQRFEPQGRCSINFLYYYYSKITRMFPSHTGHESALPQKVTGSSAFCQSFLFFLPFLTCSLIFFYCKKGEKNNNLTLLLKDCCCCPQWNWSSEYILLTTKELIVEIFSVVYSGTDHWNTFCCLQWNWSLKYFLLSTVELIIEILSVVHSGIDRWNTYCCLQQNWSSE